MENVLFVLIRRMRLPLITVLCVYAVSVLGFVLIPGVDDEGRVWRMDFFHAFYFVSFMGSTIGFGEIPFPFTVGPAGRTNGVRLVRIEDEDAFWKLDMLPFDGRDFHLSHRITFGSGFAHVLFPFC